MSVSINTVIFRIGLILLTNTIRHLFAETVRAHRDNSRLQESQLNSAGEVRWKALPCVVLSILLGGIAVHRARHTALQV